VSHFVCAQCRARGRHGAYRTVGLLAVVVKGEHPCAVCRTVGKVNLAEGPAPARVGEPTPIAELMRPFLALADTSREYAFPPECSRLEELQRNAARAHRNYTTLARGEGDALLEIFADKLGWTLAQRAGAAVLWANKAAQLYAEARRMAGVDPDPTQGDVP